MSSVPALVRSRRLWHAAPPEEVWGRLATDPRHGLCAARARELLQEHGPNALAEPPRRSALALFLGQLRSPLIYLLFVAALVALLMGERDDAAVILLVVSVNSLVGALQEVRAQRSMQALRHLSSLRARVVRDGAEAVIPARELVPGDLLLLAPGDAVGADARLLEAVALEVCEAALTGESLPVRKATAPVSADAPLADRRDMVWAGTHVAAGRGRAVVVATGADTEVGEIATLTEAAREPPTPLQRRIDQLGRWVIVVAGLLFSCTVSIGLLRGLPAGEILLVAVSQVVSMIPEGLPVAMTVALAVGMQRMARRGVIVRRLAAVETLGATTTVCSDKTGTLTCNQMTAVALVLPDGRELAVTGVGLCPAGELRGPGGAQAREEPALQALLEACVLCNDAVLCPGDGGAIGDPTETALLVLAGKGGLDPAQVLGRHPRRAEVPFDPAARVMATEHADGAGTRVVIKGAPEVVLSLCGGLAPEARRHAELAAERLAERALRVLALAELRGPGEPRDGALAGGIAGLQRRASWLGLVGEIDPPRAGVRDAIAACRAAGVRTLMVTGDHAATGLAIARELGIAAPGDRVVDGRELTGMSDLVLCDAVEQVSVFARVHPAQKLRIVAALQARGQVVAMTGDGINDAPALASADVGVAMGISGTEVAKQAAKVVVTDDDFSTIVRGVEEGRLVRRNLQKVLLYLISTSLAESAVLLLALVLGLPLPLAAVHILWINVVCEGTVTVNLIMEGLEGDEMRRRPSRRDEPLLPRALLQRMALMTPAITLLTFGYFLHGLASGAPFELVRTGTFTLLAVAQWFNALNCRSETRTALSLDLLRNAWLVGGLLLGVALHAAVVFTPSLNLVFHTVPLPGSEVLWIVLLGSCVLWVEEARKLRARRRDRAHGAHPART